MLRSKIGRFLFALVPAGAAVAIASLFHAIHTPNGLSVIRKWEAGLAETYVDLRPPGSDARAHPRLALTLLFRGRTDLISSSASGREGEGTFPAAALMRGARYLEASQQAEGSWRSFNSRSASFSGVREQPRVFPTIFILHLLKDVPSVDRRTVSRGLDYLRRQMRDDYLFSVDGRDHELSRKWDRLPCWMPPDADDTAMAWLLMGRELGGEALQRVHEVFARHETAEGTYPTYFTALGEPNACPPDYENRPSLGVNIDVLAFLEHYGLESSRLLDGLEALASGAGYWEDAVYYRSPSTLALLAALAVSNGAPSAERFLERFLADHEERARAGGASLTPLERAAYVAAAAERCRLRGLDCDSLRSEVDDLLRLQRRDGSWPAAALYQASQGHYGSPAETTAIAVRALDAWLGAEREERGNPKLP